MTTLLIDALIVFWLLLFGGMALLPIVSGGRAGSRRPAQAVEDRVISIAPSRPATLATGQRAPLPRHETPADRTAA